MNPVAIPFYLTFGALFLAGVLKLVQYFRKLSELQKLYYIVIFTSSLMLGFLVIIGTETYARCIVEFDSISHASSESLRNMVAEPIRAILHLLPFAVIGLITAALSKDGEVRQGCCLAAGGFIPAALWFAKGNIGILHSIQKHAWTAAALSSGFMPFMSLPLVIGGIFAGFLLSKLLDKLKI